MNLESVLEEAVVADVERRDASCAACGCRDLEADVWGVGEGLNGAEARAAVECTDCGARLNVRVTEELLKEAREEADAS